MERRHMSNIQLFFGDGIDGLLSLPAKSADCIICDPPYETTRNKWDVRIPFPRFWKGLLHVAKPNAAICVFGAGLFSAELMLSNPKMWRYKWIWEKKAATGFLNAKKMPLRAHEEIHIFYKKMPCYNPQKTEGHPPVNNYKRKLTDNGPNYGRMTQETSGGGNTDRYPRDVLLFSSDKQKSAIHPTQKPEDLIRYLVRTYTNPGDLIVDPTAGSGTLGIACQKENRHVILFDNDKKHYENAKKRLFS